MRLLPESPFTVDQALAAGLTYSALRNALRRGRIVRVRHGVYADAAALDHPATAVPLRVASAVISHRSAAQLHGLPLVGTRVGSPEITVPPRASTNIADTHPYRARLRAHDVVVLQDRPVTSPARTVVDVARHWPVRTSVPALDAALFTGLTTAEEIQDVLDFCRDWPGARRAKRAVALADGRAESPLESISRLAIARLGFPPPEPQKEIFDELGRFVGRSDFYWDHVGVVGEADGRGKYQSEDAYPREKDRQEAFEDLGLIVARWGWALAWNGPDALGLKIANAFERGRRRDRSGFPRLWTFRPPS
jgi:hypothetical protein